jgi:hypothetical protein
MEDGRFYILLGEGTVGWRLTRGYAADMVHAITLAVIDGEATGKVYNVGEPEALKQQNG